MQHFQRGPLHRANVSINLGPAPLADPAASDRRLNLGGSDPYAGHPAHRRRQAIPGSGQVEEHRDGLGVVLEVLEVVAVVVTVLGIDLALDVGDDIICSAGRLYLREDFFIWREAGRLTGTGPPFGRANEFFSRTP